MDSKLSRLISHRAEDSKNKLMQRRANMTIFMGNGSDMKALKICAGGTMGDGNEPEAFMGSYYKAFIDWTLDTHELSKPWIVRSAIDGSVRHMGFGTFIDDLFRISTFNSY